MQEIVQEMVAKKERKNNAIGNLTMTRNGLIRKLNLAKEAKNTEE